MSPTGDRSTGDSDPRSSTSRIGAGQPERDHATPEPPSVERLTPCTDDRCLPHNTDHSGRTESAVQSLLSHLRLPLILDSILRITDENEQLSQGLRSALNQRSVPEQHRIEFFACSLSRNCDDLQDHEQFDGGDVRFHDDVALGSAIEPRSAAEPPAAAGSIEPAYVAENEEGDITPDGRDEVHGSDTQSCADHDEVKQSTFQRTDGRDPQLIHVEDVDERSGRSLDAFCTATFRPKTGVSEGTSAMVSGASASVTGTTLVAMEELGSSILLKNAYRQLAKSPEPALDTLVKELPGSPEKVTVLRLLDSITSDMLLVKGTDFRFDVDSLLRLNGTRWLNDEVILACLHLSDKLAFVRVGFSIRIHRRTRSHSTIPRPFERAVKQMAKWHQQAEARSLLVCFFPLFQHQNHFSLLEINEREGSIFHYDAMGKGGNADVKVRIG
ncbi:hypothetical protein QQX98_002179 [Neonectria punicea]|uniref:Ubiquitin-like protease family profile domain-containing protein n=1 Tax=Neonectria punicea TaxID=979145 RepID=A0ABR1HJX5_9HYPO